MSKILGIDIGINNVGYGLIDDEKGTVIKAGVRIFPESQRNANEDRRAFRHQRRQIRRRRHRLDRIKDCLAEHGLPVDKTSANPYLLRKNALYEKIELWELSAALLHIAKRRGSVLDIPEEESTGDNELSTKEQIKKNDSILKGRYICEIQLERLNAGKVRGHENKFRLSDYVKEAEAILNNQKKYHPEITDEFINEYMEILQSRRMYYDGPGSFKSQSPYGIEYYYDENGELRQTGMIDKMRGKCTFFPDQPRIAKMTYTADLFNLLNDLNNISFNGMCLSEDDKRYLVENYVDKGKNLTPDALIKYICKNYDVDKDNITGFRINLKNNKEILTEFKGFNILKKYIDNNNLPSILYEDKELADEIIEILTSYKDFKNRKVKLKELLQGCMAESDINDVVYVLKDDTKFKEYHSLSRLAIESILDDLWKTNDNQMQLFTEKGFFDKKSQAVKGKNIVFDDTAILSTVAKRSHREAIKIINKIREIYGELDGIVIEMAREKNSDEQKQILRDLQKKEGDFEEYLKSMFDVSDLSTLGLNGKQWTALKLWKEQDGKCIYSHKSINIYDIKDHFSMFEIDHIIPISISCDDSLQNKVLCYASENQKKGQGTPFEYLSAGNGQISYDQFKAEVLRIYKGNRVKTANLLEERDVKYNKYLRKEFINRNLVDTRYACRSLMSTLKDYFKTNNIDTKVYSVKGSFTDSFRRAAGIKKDRDESYKHHAIDALIVASMAKVPSFMNIQKYILNESDKIIDRETGEIIDDNEYFNKKILRFIGELKRYDEICYSHKVDRKVNRSIMGQQTIYSAKKKEDGEYVINKFSDIYTLGKTDCTRLIDMLRKTPEKFLIFENNKDIYEKLIKIIDEYKNYDNPFAAYKKEYGFIVKKGNVPVKNLRYYERKLGIHLDISHKYINPRNKVILRKMQYLRIDIYKNEKGYRYVALPYMCFLSRNNEFVITQKRYNELKAAAKIDDSYDFCFSLYKHDLFAYVDKNNYKSEAIYLSANNKNTQKIETDCVYRAKKRGAQGKFIKTLTSFKNIVKINTDVLGNKYYIYKEKFPKLSLQF